MCYTEVMPEINTDDYISTTEAGRLLGVGAQRIRDLIDDERLDAVKLGRTWYVSRESVDNFERRKPGRPPKNG